MDLRVIARVRDIDEDSLLKEISELTPEPDEVSYVWSKKYIKPFDVNNYWELDKGKKTVGKKIEGKKTVLVYRDGTIDIILENIDNFAIRLDKARKRSKEEGEDEYPIEEGIEMECEEDEEE
jgi:hypothetical protein